MTIGGWVTMGLSVGFVLVLFGWSVQRVLFGVKAMEKLHGIEDIEKGED
jgi:hypothetical protein